MIMIYELVVLCWFLFIILLEWSIRVACLHGMF